MVKDIDDWGISAGIGGNGWARRAIAAAWTSKAATPVEPATRLETTLPLRFTVKATVTVLR